MEATLPAGAVGRCKLKEAAAGRPAAARLLWARPGSAAAASWYDRGLVRWRGQAGVTRRGGAGGIRSGLLGLLLALAAPAALADSEVRVAVKGVSGDLLENVTAYVGRVGSDDLAAWRNTRTRLYATVQEALRAMGYYSPDVDISHDGKGVTIAIRPGAPVRVRRLRTEFVGEADSDPAFAALRDNLPLKEGDILNLQIAEALKTAIRLLRAYARGSYRQIPYRSLLALTAGLVYFVSPFDAIPDFLVTIGFIDDLAVLTLVLRQIEHDLSTFRTWEAHQHATMVPPLLLSLDSAGDTADDPPHTP
jgi:uncharacterized membrane protein YkvA (DUF1232 family)